MSRPRRSPFYRSIIRVTNPAPSRRKGAAGGGTAQVLLDCGHRINTRGKHKAHCPVCAEGHRLAAEEDKAEAEALSRPHCAFGGPGVCTGGHVFPGRPVLVPGGVQVYICAGCALRAYQALMAAAGAGRGKEEQGDDDGGEV